MSKEGDKIMEAQRANKAKRREQKATPPKKIGTKLDAVLASRGMR